MTRDGGVILDNLAVVVGDPDATIRPVREVHGMTPCVGAGGKFGFLLAWCAPNLQRRTLFLDQRAMYKIPRRFADKILSLQSRQSAVPVHHRTTRGGEPAISLTLRGAVTRVVIFEVGGVIRTFLPPRMRFGNRVGSAVASW